MSNELTTNLPKQSIFKGMGTSLGISALMSGGFGAASSIKRNKGLIGAIKATNGFNGTVNSFLKNNTLKKDIFTTNYAAARNYEAISSAGKEAIKAAKKLDKFTKKGKLTLWQKFRGVTEETLKSNNLKAQENLADVTRKLEAGQDVSGVLSRTMGQNAGALFKQELLNPFNILFVAFSGFTRIKNEVLPTFKNEGKIAGIKKTVEVTFKTLADTISNASFSVVGRILGSTIGSIAGPIGRAVGGTLGDIIGSFFSNKFITKVFKEDKPVEVPKIKTNEQTKTQNKKIYA